MKTIYNDYFDTLTVCVCVWLGMTRFESIGRQRTHEKIDNL